MIQVLPPAVAGRFYPGSPDELRTQVQALLGAVSTPLALIPKALVVPHAGYVYSGPVAASAYRLLRALRDRVQRVVLFGPAHRLWFRGLAFSTATHVATPLGTLAVDRLALQGLHDLPFVEEQDAPFLNEHCLEVQYPFLQTLLPEIQVVPLLVGDAEPEQVAEVMARLWGGDETLLLISSDLSHHHPYAQAQAFDRATTQAIETLTPEAIGDEQACGRIPLKGLLQEARRRGLSALTLDVRNSGDTAGSRDRVVGYGAYVFH